jgi:hypothetical protein
MNPSRHRTQILALAAAFWLAWQSAALAVTPESPEVKQVVAKALAWLEKQTDERLGGKCLIALALHKGERPPNHPKIVAALRACESAIATPEPEDNYSIGLALILLCEVDAVRHRSLAEKYLAVILKRQQEGGGWGYDTGSNVGDTSQTQYPTLAMWLAANNGLDVPNTAIEKVCAFLIRTQDPSGAWGYQTNDPGNFQRAAQMDIKPSLTAAGLGALYISADLLGITGNAAAGQPEAALPAALKLVEDAQQPKRRRPYVTKAIDHALARRAMADGDAWLQKNIRGDPIGFIIFCMPWSDIRAFANRR